MSSPVRANSDLGSEIGASGALLVYSIAVAVGFARVFSGWDFFDNLVVICVVGHGVALALRLVRAPVWVAFPVSGLALLWLIGAMYYRETYAFLFPTSDTWALFQLELDVIGEQFRTAVAPVPFLGGWEVLASAGIAASVLLADTFAFRAFARAEALVPGGVLFVFVAALGDDRSRIPSTMTLVAAGVIATVVLRQHHAAPRATTIGTTRSSMRRALPAAFGTAACVALVAGFVGPRLPGADAAPLYETKGGDSGSVTEVISPLVDIRSRLTNRSTAELFVVEADGESYWRSSALPEFDGSTWRIPERGLSRADGTIGQAGAGTVQIRQTITISGLGGSLLPAAADPIAATGDGDLRDQLRWNADSATLVKTGDELARGDRFEIISASPRLTADTLRSATSVNPGDPIYLDLPSDFPDSVITTAQQVTAGTSTPYETALALQNWMRTEFDYSLEIQEGHSNNAIESFLRNRVGYCEQFAGSYAAMMRSLGVPARVAVGFTEGASVGDGSFSVLGRNAHAWPEVWFDGIGWVPFEPTPGRGAPGAEDYTGVAPQQDLGPTTADEEPATTEPAEPVPTDSSPTTSVVPGDAAPTPTTVAPTPAGGTGDDQIGTGESAAPSAAEPGVSVPWRTLLFLALIGLLAALPATIRAVRRSSARSGPDQLDHLWVRAKDALHDMGLDDAPDRTPTETALATAAVFPVASRPMQSLAEIVTLVAFAPDGAARLADEGSYGTTTLQSCATWVRQVERAVADSLSPFARIRRYFTRLN